MASSLVVNVLAFLDGSHIVCILPVGLLFVAVGSPLLRLIYQMEKQDHNAGNYVLKPSLNRFLCCFFVAVVTY